MELAAIAPVAPQSAHSAGEIILWLGALLVLIALGATAIFLMRRSLRRPEDSPPEGFTLQQLRDLRASGALTEDEYQRARAAVIGRHSTRGPEEPKTGPVPEHE